MKSVSSGKIFGSVTVGERGQVVIPADVRKSFKIKSGDKLIVLAKQGMFSFVPADNFNQFISDATELMAKLRNKNLLAEG
jgi:AbrB family looped-hinge helix DNA binding protein